MLKKSSPPRFSHIVLSVRDYIKSIQFYDLIFPPMGFQRINCTDDFTAYCDGHSKVILSPVDERYQEMGYHRKAVGMNHLAFYATSMEDVDSYLLEVLQKNNIPTLYENGPMGDEEYYSLFFEDPDRMKIEYVFAPRYCDLNSWPSNIENNFDPY